MTLKSTPIGHIDVHMEIRGSGSVNNEQHGCPSKGTPWALCTQPRPAVWGDFTPVLLIVHTSGYFHMHIGATDWSRFQCHLWALSVDLWVLEVHMRYAVAAVGQSDRCHDPLHAD